MGPGSRCSFLRYKYCASAGVRVVGTKRVALKLAADVSTVHLRSLLDEVVSHGTLVLGLVLAALLAAL